MVLLAVTACGDTGMVIDGIQCQGSAGPPTDCPDRGCPQTFTTEPTAVCPSDPAVKRPVSFYTGCGGGLEIILYPNVDTFEDIFYRSSDGSFVGYGSYGVGGPACVRGVPDGFSIDSCGARTTIVCGQ
jgi:hypothetical protein